MGFINIVDDRDIIYNQAGVFGPPSVPKSTTIYKQIAQQLQNEFSAGNITHLGEGFFHIELAAITCTGSDVTQNHSIPFKHKLHQFVVKHTDSSDADSVDALNYSLKYGLGQIKPNLLLSLLTVTASIISDSIHLFPDFWRRQNRYQLITNSTNTDLLYVSLIVEVESVL